MLKTSCILTPRSPLDGIRVSVMSRHTLNDGKTPDERIIRGISYDEHRKELAPPGWLVGRYYRWGMGFKEYEWLYRFHLGQHLSIVKQLVDLALTRDVTVLCIEDAPDQCHRRILAQVCSEVSGLLQIEIH